MSDFKVLANTPIALPNATQTPVAASDKQLHDVVIVGSGPAGYTAAIYTARAGLQPIVIAGEVESGGALVNTTEVENYPGFPEGIQGPDLMARMQEQAEKFGADVRFEDAIEFDLESSPKVIKTADETYKAQRVILALGSAYRKLDVPGESELAGRGVSYCATCDGFFFKDQHIAVVGGGDTAAEEALFLAKFGSKVTLIHRRDELRASQIMTDRVLCHDRIEVAWNSRITSINGTEKVDSVTLEDVVTGEQRELDATAVFIAIGHDPRTELVKDQLATHSGYITVNDPQTETSIPGVFACGDVVDFRYQQAISAAGSGCRAAMDAERSLENLECNM